MSRLVRGPDEGLQGVEEESSLSEQFIVVS
jgi:hypothetical protein